MATFNGNSLTGTEKFRKNDIINFQYSGAAKEVTLAPGKYRIECWGAQGGTYSSYGGGKGGYSFGLLTIADNTKLFVTAGGQPEAVTSGTAPGGFNGGGTSKAYSYSGTSSYGQGGGGGSDVRIATNDLYARVVVAGGGAGSSSINVESTGCGGGPQGSSAGGSSYTGKETSAGSGGAFGQGGHATGSNNYKYGAGGGGGGWYGGGVSTSVSDSSTSYRTYCGGGSGYIYTSSTASQYPSGCKLNSAYYLQEADTWAGTESFISPEGISENGHFGNGYVRITVIEGGGPVMRVKVNGTYKESSAIKVKVNGVWKDASSVYTKVNGVWKESK